MRNCPERFVFIDETSVKANMTRLRGRCKKGKRLYGSAPFGRWQTQTFIAGLTCEALVAPSGDRRRDGPRRLRHLHRDPTRPRPGTRDCRHSRQPRHPQKPPRRGRFEKTTVLDAVPARLFPRPEPDRNGSLKIEIPPQTHRSQNLRSTHQRHRRHLLALPARRMLEFLPGRKLCARLKAKCFKSTASR